MLGRVEATARAWRTLLRRALPGPWNVRTYVSEGTGILGIGVAAALPEAVVSGGTAAAVGIGGLAAALYVLRRGLPGVVLVASAVSTGIWLGCVPLLVCAGWSAGRRLERPRSLIVVFTTTLVLMPAVSWWNQPDPWALDAVLALNVTCFFALVLLPALVGRYQAQRRTLLATLQERHDQLLRERIMVARQARLRERHRIAQDMHDSLGHQLTLIAVQTGALEMDRGLAEPHRAAVQVLRQAAVAAMGELRQVVGVLHDDSVAESSGGVDDIEGLVDATRQVGTRAGFRCTGQDRPLSAATGQAAYRIVQEALTNAHKHAPGAAVEVALHYEPDALVVEVVNAPPAAPSAPAVPVSGSQGLAGLRERARLVGGMVRARATGDGGFRVAGVLPYEATGSAAPDDDSWLHDMSPAGPEPADSLGPVSYARHRAYGRTLAVTVGATAAVLTAMGLFLVW